MPQHLDKIIGHVDLYRAHRARALTLPKAHPAHGIPAVQDNGDLYSTAIDCGTTYGAQANRHSFDGVVTGDVALDCHTTMPYVQPLPLRLRPKPQRSCLHTAGTTQPG